MTRYRCNDVNLLRIRNEFNVCQLVMRATERSRPIELYSLAVSRFSTESRESRGYLKSEGDLKLRVQAQMV